MAARSHLELVSLNVRVPRGNEAFWREIKRLDAAGPWTISDVVNLTNVSTRVVSQFVDNLRKNAIAHVVGTRPLKTGGHPQQAFRLTKRPAATPRFSKSGDPLPETQIETLWRTMKMAKVFTTSELVSLASSEGRAITYRTARAYVCELTRVRILVTATPGGPGKEACFRLARNLGSRAPKVLAARVIYDPNANVVVGEADAREVSA